MGMFQTTGSNTRFGVLESSVQRTIAAAGAAQATATLLAPNVNIVTGATGANGVILPRAKNTPYTAMVYSSAATNALLVYPPVGGTINNAGLNAALSLPARKPVILTSINNIDFVANISA